MLKCPLEFISGKKLWSTKVYVKVLSDLAIFLILSSGIPVNFHYSMPVVLVRYLMYFSAVLVILKFLQIIILFD